MSAHEYDYEPIPGVPGIPPAGERILWHGSPDWKSVLIHVLAGRWFLAYFAVLTAWRFQAALADGLTLGQSLTSALWLMPMWAGVMAGLVAFAVALSRTTIYTITTKRLIMRYGIALPMAVNVPFTKVTGANLKLFKDGSGQLPLTLDGDVRLAYLMIWPHARAGYLINPQPMLRSLPNPQAVAKILASALCQQAAPDQAANVLPANIARPLKPMQIPRDRPYTNVAAE
jgi:hypothetical protein